MLIWIISGFILLAVGYFVGIFNMFVRLQNRVKNSWSQIDVQLKRRHNLIPNLVECVRAYAVHEKSTLEQVTSLRNLAAGASEIQEKIRTEGLLQKAMGKLMLVVENYPDLKADSSFLALHEELTSTENRISFARQAYNDQVLRLNNRIEMFPSNVIARMFHFSGSKFFDVSPADAIPPAVRLTDNS